MKRSLLQTTALVTAGLVVFADSEAWAQQKTPQVTISGFYDVDVFWSKQKEGAVGKRARVDLITDTEILFNVRVDLDNGIRLDGRVELEGNSVVTDPIDETWLRAQGFFGQLYLGARNVEAYKNTYLAPDVGTGTEDFQNLVANPSGASASGESPFLDPRLRMGCDDCDNITYVTPRWDGFQLTGSYMPNTVQDDNASVSTIDTVYGEGYAVGLNFDRKFDALQIGLNAHYQSWTKSPAGRPSDPWGLSISGQIRYAGFTIGGAFMKIEDFRATATNSQDGTGFEVGASYAWGPNAVSFVYRDGEDEDTTTIAGSDEIKVYAVSYNRNIGPGVRFYASGLYAKLDGESPATTDDNKAWVLLTGLGLRF